MKSPSALAVRWTIGNVSPYGFEALRLSLWGAWRLFGPHTEYVVCVNSLPLELARAQTGPVPNAIQWRDVTHEVPDFFRAHLDEHMAEGVGWKFAPVRLFPERYELSLDNDCILWKLPLAIHEWLTGPASGNCVIAEDERRMLGVFEDLCGPGARNSGIRGLPPEVDLGAVLREILAQRPVKITSELDEQGLQVAAVSHRREPLLVHKHEVTICSPFWPLCPELGTCGAHFVGLNSRQLPWNYYDRPASDWVREHFARHRPQLYARVGLCLPGDYATPPALSAPVNTAASESLPYR